MAITIGASTITMNSGSVLQDPPGTAPSFLCRAFVNFNGIGTVAIRASGNVSSITDNGTGDYTVNFTTAMPDVNYAAIANAIQADNTGGRSNVINAFSYATGSVRLVSTRSTDASQEDVVLASVAIFR